MKHATKHAERLRSLCKSLLKDGVPEPPAAMEPLTALVRGAMSFDVPDPKAEEAMKHINREFVDLNELRVATQLEIQELLGVRYPHIQQRVEMITQGLSHIFEKEHTLSLDRLKTLPKREVRQFIKELPGIHPFVEAYVVMFGFDGAAFPLDAPMMQHLEEQGAVESQGSLEEAQRFVESHVKAEQMRDLFLAMRKAVYERPAARKKSRA